MNIVILVSKLYPWIGGTEKQTETIARELHKRGHNITILTRLFPDKNKPGRELPGINIKRFFYLNYPVIRFFIQFLKFFNYIRKKRNNIDVLLCMQLTPNGFIGIAAKKFFKIPVISYVRGGDWYFAKNAFFGRRIVSQVLKKSDLVLVQTEKIKNEILAEFPKTKIEIIPNGIYPYHKISAGKNIIFVGNIVKRKGVEYLVSAMKDTGEKLIIAGDGPLKKNLEKHVHENNIKFVGYIPHKKIRNFMCKEGKILVLPAISGEGLPNVILEAMSVGIPVIATKLAGIPDVVKDGETGILVEPRNANSLKKAILKLSKNEKLRKMMSRNCLIEIKKYYWKNVTRKLEREFAVVIKS